MLLFRSPGGSVTHSGSGFPTAGAAATSIGGVEDFAQLRRKREERYHSLAVAPPTAKPHRGAGFQS